MIIDATFTESHSKIDANFGILSKGEKGDAFTYEDFTEEQLEDLRCTDRWENHEKRITNLEKKISADFFVTDEDTAYKKTVPSNACPFAQINSIGGMSYKSKNLISILPWANQTITGVTITLDKDGVYHLSGTATATSACLLPLDAKLPIGKYTLSLNCNKVIGTAFENAVYLVARSADGDWKIQSSTHLSSAYITVTTTVDIVDFMFAFMEGVNCDGLTIAPMCNEGDYIPYEPYYEGLRDSKVTEIKSHGKNMFNKDADCYQYTIGEDVINESNAYRTWFIDVRGLDNVCISHNNLNTAGDLMVTAVRDTKLGTPIDMRYRTLYKGQSHSISLQGNNYVAVSIWHTWVDEVAPYIQVEAGSGATEFEPHREPISYPIPNEIQALEGYGEDGFTINTEEQTYTFGDVTNPLPIAFEPFIEVEGGGVIEFVNEYEKAVPTSITYLLKESAS